MSYQISPELEELIRAKMASGRYASEEELIKSALISLDADEDDLEAIQEGLDSIDRGEPGIPLEKAFQDLRAKYHIPDVA